MKLQAAAATLALVLTAAFATAPAEARVAKPHAGQTASATPHAKAATKKTGKAKHRKQAKKGSHKSA